MGSCLKDADKYCKGTGTEVTLETGMRNSLNYEHV